jgi:hypothetical protein
MAMAAPAVTANAAAHASMGLARKENTIGKLQVRRKSAASLEAGGITPRTIDFQQGPEYIALFASTISPDT